MIKTSVLICLTILSLVVGNAYCMTAVNPSYSNQVPDDKAAVAKSGDTVGKSKAVPGSNTPITKTNSKIINNNNATETTGGAVNVTKQHLLLEKVDGNTFYTKDGNRVEIPSNVKITDNTRNGEVVNAELTYVNGELIEAMIR